VPINLASHALLSERVVLAELVEGLLPPNQVLANLAERCAIATEGRLASGMVPKRFMSDIGAR